jgi:hypothetical protein
MDDQRFETPDLLADRLGALRDRIRALKAEESALRARIVQHGAPLNGMRYQVAVRRGFRRVLNVDALPPAIRNDPRYWTATDSCTVTCRRITAPMPRQIALPLTEPPGPEEEDIILIEPF